MLPSKVNAVEFGDDDDEYNDGDDDDDEVWSHYGCARFEEEAKAFATISTILDDSWTVRYFSVSGMSQIVTHVSQCVQGDWKRSGLR